MDLTPQRVEFAQADHGWLKSAHGVDAARSATIDISTFTENTHYADGYLPDGTPLAEVDGLFVLYDASDNAGAEVLAGFLIDPVSVATGAETVIGALLDHGRVDLDRLPFVIVPADAETTGQFVFLNDGGS